MNFPCSSCWFNTTPVTAVRVIAMATEGEPGPSGAEDRRESLTCAVCHDLFTQPRALPCLHTFCLKCLQKLISWNRTPTFPCPQCRADTTVPREGAAAFPANFHIHEELELVRKGKLCKAHPKKELDLFCVDCQIPVCGHCMATEHNTHKCQQLAEATAEAKTQLEDHSNRLKKAVTGAKRKLKTEERHPQQLQEKKAAVESLIHNKCKTLVSLAERHRDELLASLNTACQPLEQEATAAVNIKTTNLHNLQQLQEQIRQTLDSGTDLALLALAKESTEDTRIGAMMSEERSVITHPVLTSLGSLDMVTQLVGMCLGSVNMVQMKLFKGFFGRKVEKKLECRKHPETEVFSLYHAENGRVYVSYATIGLDENGPVDVFQESGEHLGVELEALGKCSMKMMACGNTNRIVFHSKGTLSKFSKHECDLTYCYQLQNGIKGKAGVNNFKVTSWDPLTIKLVSEFIINVGCHRAFDVDSSEQFFAVVEEAEKQGQPRKVKLFQRDKADPVTTYTAPSALFQPSDVCFVKPVGKKSEAVLLIADEGGDSVHVVHVQGGVMTFQGHLVPGHPLLVQPTALNKDNRGRLWVACRGGNILTFSSLRKE